MAEKYKKGMSKEDVYEKLEGFKTDSGKINYLKKISEKEGLLNEKTKKSVYETLGNLLEGINYEESANAYEKAGLEPDAKKQRWNLKAENLLREAIDEDYKPWNFDASRNKVSFWKDAALLYELSGNKEGLKNVARKLNFYLKPDLAIDLYRKAGFKDEEIMEEVGSPAELQKKSGTNEGRAYARAAEKLFDGYGKSSLKSEEVSNLIGRKNLVKGRYEMAIRDFEKAGLNKSNNLDDLNTMSDVYEKAGDSTKSMDIQRKIKKIKNKKK